MPGPGTDGERTEPPARAFAADLPAENLHRPMIEALHGRGVVKGCDVQGFRYCPSDVVTRAQMATFLARALALPEARADHFSDDGSSVHESSVNRLAEAGIATGFGDGTFRPSLPVTREQMATFLVRGFKVPMTAAQRFDDVSGVHQDHINAIASDGLTSGCSQTAALFCPTETVRRDQMASFIARAMDR